MTLSLNPAKACGALIVISKLLKSRPELKSFYLKAVTVKEETASEKLVTKKIEEMVIEGLENLPHIIVSPIGKLMYEFKGSVKDF